MHKLLMLPTIPHIEQNSPSRVETISYKRFRFLLFILDIGVAYQYLDFVLFSLIPSLFFPSLMATAFMRVAFGNSIHCKTKKPIVRVCELTTGFFVWRILLKFAYF